MKLEEFLQEVQKVAAQNNCSQPYLVGGAPRDKVMGRLDNLADIDFTTGDETVFILAQELAVKLAPYIEYFKIMDDKHASLKIGNLKVDFSNHFVVPEAQFNKTAILQEMYSRDFTCNTLLWSLDLKNILDLTNQAIKSIQKKEIKTCLAPQVTLSRDPKRIVRAIYLASKLNFELEEETSIWIKNNAEYLKLIDQNYIVKKIIKAIKYNEEKAISLIKDHNLIHFIPASAGLSQFIQKIL